MTSAVDSILTDEEALPIRRLVSILHDSGVQAIFILTATDETGGAAELTAKVLTEAIEDLFGSKRPDFVDVAPSLTVITECLYQSNMPIPKDMYPDNDVVERCLDAFWEEQRAMVT